VRRPFVLRARLDERRERVHGLGDHRAKTRGWMREIVKRPRAREDLKGIWRYSFTEWGEAQADKNSRNLISVAHGSPYMTVRSR